MNQVMRQLIRKDIYLNRWIIIGASVTAVISVAVASAGPIGFNVGALMWLTTIVASGVMLALYGIVNERKERTLEFVLSLPLSFRDYHLSKLVGLLICFGIPWLSATIAAVVLIIVTALPDGLLPFVVLLCGFLLSNYCVVLCASLHARTERASTAMIIVTNMAVTLFMFVVGAIPSLRSHMASTVPVWNETFYIVLVIELSIAALALGLPFLLGARRADAL